MTNAHIIVALAARLAAKHNATQLAALAINTKDASLALAIKMAQVVVANEDAFSNTCMTLGNK